MLLQIPCEAAHQVEAAQQMKLRWALGCGSAPNWYGVTINYQMDGAAQPYSFSVYLDNLSFSYD